MCSAWEMLQFSQDPSHPATHLHALSTTQDFGIFVINALTYHKSNKKERSALFTIKVLFFNLTLNNFAPQNCAIVSELLHLGMPMNLKQGIIHCEQLQQLALQMVYRLNRFQFLENATCSQPYFLHKTQLAR